MKRPPTAEAMLVRMAGLCAGSEQCSRDIKEKILKNGFTTTEAERMIAYLVENGYIDDSRYARSYAADKVRFSGWGKLKIRMYLKGKRIPEEIIMQALEYVEESDYAESLRKALEAKAKSLELFERGERLKLYRHLMSRGYEPELITQEIRRYIKQERSKENGYN